MSLSLFLNFDGNCKEATEFYAKAFDSKVKGVMTFAQMPVSPEHPIAETDKDKILYSEIEIFGANIMFSDVPAGMPIIWGNNISPTLGSKDKEKIKSAFTFLKEDGQVLLDLQQTFWSDYYGMVKDKYGVTWQFSHDNEIQS